ncbi:MAG TPA: 3-hydroxyacyl-ACP dehydratase FabZ [Firmicutes bacterium]|nr:3-hydroxyacyl-ACP dehydratase FabZ [Bacillota bacterium]
MLDNVAIRKLLPHRYPMLLVDRVLELEPGKRAVVIKNVTANEPFFQGHYPSIPIMPGVLIIEAMAQAAGLAIAPESVTGVPLLTGIDNARFRKMAVPGDQIRIEITVLRRGSRLGKVSAIAMVEGAIIAEAELIFTYLEQSKAD